MEQQSDRSERPYWWTSTDSCKIRPCSLVWTTERPDGKRGRTTKRSPPFFFKKQKCCLVLQSAPETEFSWYSLRIEADLIKLQSNYGVQVSLEYDGKTVLTCNCLGVIGRSYPSPQTIWQAGYHAIRKEFREFFSPKTSLKFVLTFTSFKEMEMTLPCGQSEVETAEMSTQTILNMNEVSCLESLSGDLSKFLDGDSRQDVELKCGDQIVKAHGNFLGTRSRVFAAMLQSDMTEGRTGIVEVRDMEPELFQCFIRYLYTGKLPRLTIETAIRLYEAGDKYELQGLSRRCSYFLRQNLAPANACDLLVLANAHSDLDFKKVVFSYILEQKIPLQDCHWRDFCDGHPCLANQVLNRFCKMQEEMYQSCKKRKH